MRKLYTSILFVLLMVFSVTASAVLRIEITDGVSDGRPMAIVPFGWAGPGQVSEDIAQIVSNDLMRSGEFKVASRDNLVAAPTNGSQVNYADWNVTGTEYLVIGNVKPNPKGGYDVQFQLFDVFKQQQLLGYSFPVPEGRMRQVAHEIADLIYEKITGIRGAFNTRIAYISTVRDQKGKKRYLLQVADSDGERPKTILHSKLPLMSPAWSPDGRQVAYVSFENRSHTAIYVQDVKSSKRRKLSSIRGINGAPSWSPDGKKLVVTLSNNGNPDIYVLDAQSGRKQRLTRNRAIDTEPTWSADGDYVVFTSDRSGSPQIYRVAVNGGRPDRITFEGRYNASPAISPDGRQMTFVTREQGRFRVAVMDLNTRSMRVLTDGRLDESPSFAPNGQMILYATEGGGRGILGAVSTDGRMKQRLSLSGGDVREPEWSPFQPRRQ